MYHLQYFGGIKIPYIFRISTDKPMEAPMSNRTIKHEIKLQPSVIILLGLLALGVCASVFAPVFSVRKAEAAFGGGNEMIAADARGGIWQLKDGRVRLCSSDTNYTALKGSEIYSGCSSWSEQ